MIFASVARPLYADPAWARFEIDTARAQWPLPEILAALTAVAEAWTAMALALREPIIAAADVIREFGFALTGAESP